MHERDADHFMMIGTRARDGTQWHRAKKMMMKKTACGTIHCARLLSREN